MGVNGVSSAVTSEVYATYQKPADKSTTSEVDSKAAETGVVYEKSEEPAKKATYSINKMSKEDRSAIVEQLKKDQQNRMQSLVNLVSDTIGKQAKNSNLANMFGELAKKATPEQIAQAKEDVSENGYWGVKQTSQRLFDFASALAGDDVDKMKEMQKAMEKGFKLATKAWGTDLPDISHQTMDAANKLFEDYYNSRQ